MFQGRTGTANPSHSEEAAFFDPQSTIHDLQSYMIRVHSCSFAVFIFFHFGAGCWMCIPLIQGFDNRPAVGYAKA